MAQRATFTGDTINLNSLETKLASFKNNTHQVNNYNEIYNLNSYLKNVNQSEKSKLDRTNETLKGSILKAKQDYLIADRQVQFTSFKNTLLYLSIITLCLVLIVVGLQSMKIIPNIQLSATLITIILLIYLFIAFFMMLNNSNRRNTNWNQFYWSEMGKN